MNDLTAFLIYLKKIPIGLANISMKPLAAVTCIPIAAAPAVLTTFQNSCIILGIAIVGDFFTGILASWVEFKKARHVTPSSGAYLIQSTKWRMTVVKFVCYSLAVFMAYKIELTFFKADFAGNDHIKDMGFATIVAAFCTAIEIYSIFFENIKRAGFDILAKAKKLGAFIMMIIKKIKEAKNELY
jgi:hypothetical protein